MNIVKTNIKSTLSTFIFAFGLSLTGCAVPTVVADEQDGPADETEEALKTSADDKALSGAGALDRAARADDLSVAQDLVPVDEAPEFQVESGASVTRIEGMRPLLLRGSFRASPQESDLEALGERPSLQEPINNILGGYGPQLRYDGTFGYSGGLGGASYNVVVGDWCGANYVRDYGNAYTLTGSGGCSLVGWYSNDVADCRIIVHVGIPNFWKSGTCAWQVYAEEVFYQDYSTSNTSNAQQNTFDTPVFLDAGRTITVGTCGLPGVSASGDTYLRLVNSNAQTVAVNDDACGSLSSNMIYTAPSSDTYVIKAGCYSGVSCGGRLGYTVR